MSPAVTYTLPVKSELNTAPEKWLWKIATANLRRYHIPEHLVDHIDYITPGIKLFNGGLRSTNKTVLRKRGPGGITPVGWTPLPSGVSIDVPIASPTSM